MTAHHDLWIDWLDNEVTARCGCGWKQTIPKLAGESIQDLNGLAVFHHLKHLQAVEQPRNGHEKGFA